MAQIEAITHTTAGRGPRRTAAVLVQPPRAAMPMASRCGRQHARTRSSSSSAASGAIEEGGGLRGDAARGASSVPRAGLQPEGKHWARPAEPSSPDESREGFGMDRDGCLEVQPYLPLPPTRILSSKIPQPWPWPWLSELSELSELSDRYRTAIGLLSDSISY